MKNDYSAQFRHVVPTCHDCEAELQAVRCDSDGKVYRCPWANARRHPETGRKRHRIQRRSPLEIGCNQPKGITSKAYTSGSLVVGGSRAGR